MILKWFYSLTISIRDRPFNLKRRGGGLWFFVSFRNFFSDNTRARILFNLKGGLWFFFLKKYSDSQCCWKKYSDFGGGKKNNLIQSLVYIRPLFIIFSFFDWPLHCIPITLLASTKKTFLICWHIHAPLCYPNYQIYFMANRKRKKW
jgi:hypothetical protein